MSRLGLKLALAFVVVVAASLAFMTSRAVRTITDQQNAALETEATDHLAAVQRVFDREARGIEQRLLPLASVRELRYRVQPGRLLPAAADTANAEEPATAAGSLDPAGLQRFVEQILPVTGLDVLEVAALDGEVLARGQYPEAFGEVRDDSATANAGRGLTSVVVRDELFRDTSRPVLTVVMPILSNESDSRSCVAALSGGLRLDKLAEELGRLKGSIVAIEAGAIVIASSPLPAVGTAMGPVSIDNDYYWVKSVPLEVRGSPLGALRVLIPATEQVRSRDRLVDETMRLGGIVVVVAGLAGLALALGPTRRLAALTTAAKRIGAGDLDTAFGVKGSDEIGLLGETLGATALALKDERARLARTERVAAWRDAARKLAHELKNAITPIGLSLRTVKRAAEKGEAGRDVAEQSLDAIGTELSHLQSLVDQFSQFARLPAPAPTAIDIRESLSSAITLYASAGPSITFNRSADLPPVAADAELIGRVWANLLANAVAAAGPSGQIEVSISDDRSSGCCVVIRDSGPGLSPSQIRSGGHERVSTKSGGWGVGLALSERIVIEHGGELKLGNAESGGASISVVLPWAEKK